jgi:hypothetical protein
MFANLRGLGHGVSPRFEAGGTAVGPGKRLDIPIVAAKLNVKIEVSAMVEPINLNKARKAKAKTADKARASANRVAFGRTKAEKTVAKLDERRARETLDGAKREPPKD